MVLTWRCFFFQYVESESWLSSLFLQWDDRVMESWSQFTISTLSPDNSCCPNYPQLFSLRLSSRIAHSSVQVMITVIHLSFTKLLLALFDVFTPVQLYRSNINEPLNI